MEYLILGKEIATIFVNIATPIMLSFSSPVSDIIGADSNKVGGHIPSKANHGKTAILHFKTKKINDHLPIVILTEKDKFIFKFKYKENLENNTIEIGRGRVNSSYNPKYKTPNYIYYEGKTSVKFKNLKSTPITINGRKISKIGYFSKGIPFEVSLKPTSNRPSNLKEVTR